MSTRGLHETTKVIKVMEPKATTNCIDSWNGHNVTPGASSGIDMQGYDEAVVELQLGAIAGGALDVDVFENSTDSADSATQMQNDAGTDVDFDQKTSADQNLTHIIRFRAKDHKRYVYIKVTNSSADSKTYGVSLLATKADYEPVTQDNTVDYNDNVA